MKITGSKIKGFPKIMSMVWLLCAMAACDQRANREQVKENDSALVALVNGEPITWVEFERMRANPALLSLFPEVGTDRSPRDLDRLALHRLIQARLLLQEAHRRNVTVNEREVDSAVVSLRRQFGDLKQLGQWIQAQGLTEPELFESIRDDMLVNRVRAALIDGAVVSENEVQQYFRAHEQHMSDDGNVRLRIFAAREQSIAKAVANRVRAGEDFAQLARTFSQGKRAAQGGDSGWIHSSRLPSPLREIVDSLDVEEVYGPILRGTDFLIVRLEARQPMSAPTFEQVRAEVTKQALAAKQHRVIKDWLSDAWSQSEIEIHLDSVTALLPDD